MSFVIPLGVDPALVPCFVNPLGAVPAREVRKIGEADGAKWIEMTSVGEKSSQTR